jgi:hypothetical protein
MTNRKKTIIGVVIALVLILLGAIWFWIDSQKEEVIDELVPISGDLSELDKEIQAKEWDVFYPIKDWIEITDEEIDLSFLENTYSYDSGEILYDTTYLQPVIKETYVKEGVVSFDGWVYNKADDEWVLVEFVVMGDFNDLSDADAPLVMSSKAFRYLSTDGITYEEFFEEEMILDVLEPGFQISATVFRGYDESLNVDNLCNGYVDLQCIGLFLSYKINDFNVESDFVTLDQGDVVYVDYLTYNLYEYE